jgi:serine/threonine-protein kinase
MPVHPNPCDTRRLRLSIEDRLTEGEQAELAAHLEACEPCRLELERLAARSGLWGEARRLRGEPEPGKAPTIGLAQEDEPGEEDGELEDEAWLAFLDPPDPDRPGTLGRLAAYEVLELLGRGGMGIVLKARDPALERTVAIKLLTPALAHGPMARRRFAREARAAAAVGHEHIVAIYAVDEFRGLPYLVMQYIPGRSLQDRLDASGPLEVTEILRIGTQAARALAAAHAQGVVHRDIKPANILLENCVERVRLTDFGLARAMDDASLTQSGVIAGTPQYMAPEQARGESIDARSDLFALGAVLYAMAVGRPPFRANSAMAVLKRVCDDRHRPIRELNPDVPDWLEALIDRLLAKDPADRFQTAAEVADLLERGLAHLQQPTAVPRPAIGGVHDKPAPEFEVDLPVAKAPTRGRHRLAMAASVLLLTAAGLGASEASGLTSVTDFVATFLRIKTPQGMLLVKVDTPGVKLKVDDRELVVRDLDPNTGVGEVHIKLPTGEHRVQASVGGSPFRDELITISRGGKEVLNATFLPQPPVAMSLPGAAPPAAPPPPPMVMLTPAAPAGAAPPPPPVVMAAPGAAAAPAPTPAPVIASAAGAAPFPVPPPPVPPTPAGPPVAAHPSIPDARGLVWSLAFTPDGRRLAIGQQGIDGGPSLLRLWDLAARKHVFRVGHPSGYRSVAVSPDGSHLAAGTFQGTLQIWRLKPNGDFEFTEQAENIGSPVNAVCFVDGGKAVATGSWDGKVAFTDVGPGPEQLTLSFPGRIFALAASPDGKTIAAVGDEGVIHVYDIATRRQVATLKGHANAVESLDFSPDGKLLASAGNLTVRIWDTSTWQETGRRLHHSPRMLCVRFSPDGKLLAISDGNPEIRHDVHMPCSVELWDVAFRPGASRTEVRKLEGHTNSIFALAFSPDGKTLASGSMDQTVKLWNVATGTLRETIVPGETGTSSAIATWQTIGNVSAASGPNPPIEPLTAAQTRDLKLKLVDELYRKTVELQEAQSRLLSRLMETSSDPPIAGDADKARQGPKVLEDDRRDRLVAALMEQIKATADQLEHYKKIARRADDPALVALRERYDNLMADYDHLWKIRSEQIRKKLLKEKAPDSPEDLIRLRPEIESLKQKKSELMKLHDRYRELEGKASPDATKSTSVNSASLRTEGQAPAEKRPEKPR